MWILLALVFFIPFVYSGYLLSKLDRFLAENTTAIDDKGTSPAAIVLGKTHLAKQVGELLESVGVRVVYLTEPFLPERDGSFSYLFALSGNDADNIVMCRIGSKVYNTDRVVSICNDSINEGMFISEGIQYLVNDGVTAQMLYQAAARETGVTS